MKLDVSTYIYKRWLVVLTSKYNDLEPFPTEFITTGYGSEDNRLALFIPAIISDVLLFSSLLS